MTFSQAATIGLAQCLALVPGTSRSGITISMARLWGFERPEAARFSMLLALPTIAAFGLYTALELYETGSAVLQQDALLVTILSFLSALAAIAVFMRLLEKMTLLPFVIYRLILGIGLLTYVYI